MRLLIDTNILRKVCHPKRHAEVKDWLQRWLDCVADGEEVEIYVSAAADYELRRGYLWKLDRHPNEPKALARLNRLTNLLGVHAVSNDHFLAAAQHWADARRGGYPTAGERGMDWDVVIASQAAELNAVVVTENTEHLARYGVEAKNWSQIPAPPH